MSVVIHSSNVRDVRSREKVFKNVTGKRIHKPKMRLQNLAGILLLSCLVSTPEGHRGRSKVPSKYFDDYRQNQISHKNEVDDIDEKRDEKCMTFKIFRNQYQNHFNDNPSKMYFHFSVVPFFNRPVQK